MKCVKSVVVFVVIFSIMMSFFAVRPPISAQSLNLVDGSVITATAQLSNYDISRVADGNTAYNAEASKTGITSFDETGYGFFEITFSKETAVNLVKLFFNQVEAKQRPRDIAVDVKRADGVYIRVAELHNIDYDIQSDGFGNINELNFAFEEISCVALRITGNRQRTRDINNAPTANYNFRLMEIEAYNSSDIGTDNYTGTLPDEQSKYNIPVPEPVFENLLSGKEVSSPLQLSNYDISRLTDGNKSLSSDCSITSYNTANISYSEILLTEEIKISQLRLYFSMYEPAYRPKDIAVDVRLANGVYVRVAEMHNIDYQVTGANSANINTLDFKFEEIGAMAIRVSGNRQRTREFNNMPNASLNFRLVEIEGYNTIVSEEEYTGVLKDAEEKYNIDIPDPILENLALGKNVVANKELTAGNVTYFANNLTDGNKNYNAGTETNAITSWNTAKMAYYEIAFEETTKINRVNVFLTKWQKEYLPKDIAIDVRLANGVYVRAAEMHNVDYGSKENIVFSFAEIDVVAVRVTGNCVRNSSSENFRLMELEIYYYPDMPEELFTGTEKDVDEQYNIPVPDPILTNVALGKDITANETLTAGNVTYKAENLTDGNKDYSAETEFNSITKWNNTTKLGHYEIDLGEKILINQTKVFLTKWQKEYLPKEIAVDIRLANGVYVRVAEMHNIDYTGKEVLTFSFEEIEAVAIRVTGNCARNDVSENFRLMEIEAYYYPNMPAELITGTQKDSEDKYNIPVPEPVLNNLAAGKKVTANETLKVLDFTYDANFLTDGNSNYFAETQFNAITKWNKTTKMGYYEVDFGANTKLNRVALFLSQWQKEYLPKEIAIDVRLENGTYKRVAEMHDINYTDVKQLIFSFEDVEAVAFRVTGNYARNEKSENFRLMELEAYYYPDMPTDLITGTQKDADNKYNIPIPDPVLDNLAVGKKVTANETLVVEKFVYDANFLTDGNSNYFAGTDFNAITRYNSSTDCAWFEVDLGHITKFNRITVFLTQWQKEYLPKEIAIDVRLENGTYKRVAEMHNINYTDVKQLIFSFEDVKAVAFRVTGKRTRNERSDNFRLMELGAYYYPGMPKEEITGTAKDAKDEFNIAVPDPMLKNLALGMQATANEELNANDVLYSANRLTDGFSKYNCDSATAYTAITRWIGTKKIGWFEIAFKKATLLNQVKLCLSQWEKEFLPLDIAIDAKLANGTYVRVAEMHDIDYSGKQELVFYFPEQKAVAFRVVGNANRNAKSFNFRLVEIEAYYWPGMPTEKYTGTVKDSNPIYNISNEDLIVPEKDKTNNNKDNNKKPSGSLNNTVNLESVGNNTADSEKSQNILSSTEYVILFVVAAGFVLLAFIGGSIFVLLFINSKLKRTKQA